MGDHLEITVTETPEKYQIKVHLIADTSRKKLECIDKKSVVAAGKNYRESSNSSTTVLGTNGKQEQKLIPSLYEETQKLETPSKLNAVFRSLENKSSSKDTKSENPNILVTGRVVFGNFVNPDTRSAQQEAS